MLDEDRSDAAAGDILDVPVGEEGFEGPHLDLVADHQVLKRLVLLLREDDPAVGEFREPVRLRFCRCTDIRGEEVYDPVFEVFWRPAGEQGFIDLLARLPDVHKLLDEVPEYLDTRLLGHRLLFEGVDHVDEFLLDHREDRFYGVEERGFDRDVPVPYIVRVREDMDEGCLVHRVDDVRVLHRFQVTLQFREEERDPDGVDRQDVEVLEEVRALPDIVPGVCREHPVEGAGLYVVVAVVPLVDELGLEGEGYCCFQRRSHPPHTFATETGMILMPYPGWTSKLMMFPVVFRAPRTLTTSSIMTYLPPTSAFFMKR